MSKKSNTVWFTLVISAINIVFTLLLIAALIGLDVLLLYFVFKYRGEAYFKTYTISFVVCFIAGMICSMMFLGRFIDWVITKFKLEDKLAKIHGKKKGKNDVDEETKSEPETVMPDSVKEESDPWETEQ